MKTADVQGERRLHGQEAQITDIGSAEIRGEGSRLRSAPCSRQRAVSQVNANYSKAVAREKTAAEPAAAPKIQRPTGDQQIG